MTLRLRLRPSGPKVRLRVRPGFVSASGNFTPAGNIVATTVQGAIEELDAEKLALAGGTMTGNIAMAGAQTVDGRDVSVDGAKLDGIEALADVTDAGNVGAAIDGATAKTTPVDADTMPLIDSAAANVLKKVTWANIKATLKTYFDTVYHTLNANLSALAGLTSAADKLPYFTGSGTAAVTDLSSVARTLIAQTTQALMRTTGLGMSANGSSLVSAANYAAMVALLEADIEAAIDTLPNLTSIQGVSFTFGAYSGTLLNNANEAAFKAAVNLEIGVDVQAQDAELSALAGLTSAADKVPYFTGSGTAALTDFSSAGRTLVGQTTQALMRTTGLGLSANGSSLVSAANYAAMRALLDLEAGTDFNAFSARLADIAGITWNQGDLLYFNGTNLVDLAPGTSGQFLKTLGAGANPAWASIPGGGDLLAANNLSDVASAATAFANVKQAASDTATGVVELAVQSEMETGTDTARAVVPGRQHFHPSACKCWGTTTGGGTPSLAASYNMTSIADTAVGRLGVTIATDFSSANYAAQATCVDAPTAGVTASTTSKAAGSIEIGSITTAGAYADPSVGYDWAFFGDL